ncbi:MAG: DUF4116 domain-containing protein [Deltaproteobacteria bacterium]|nr:DUF4116 domain-containing protein [Deltaproteobacteria bacterium]
MRCESGYSINGVCVSADKFQKSVAYIEKDLHKGCFYDYKRDEASSVAKKLDAFILDQDLSHEELKLLLEGPCISENLVMPNGLVDTIEEVLNTYKKVFDPNTYYTYHKVSLLFFALADDNFFSQPNFIKEILRSATSASEREKIIEFFRENIELLFLQEQTHHNPDYVIELCKLFPINEVVGYLSKQSYPNVLQNQKFKGYISQQPPEHAYAAKVLLEANPEDTEFQRQIVRKNPAAYPLANPEVKKDRELALAAVNHNYNVYESLSTELKEDPEISSLFQQKTDEHYGELRQKTISVEWTTGVAIYKDLGLVLGLTASLNGRWGIGISLLQGSDFGDYHISPSYSLLPNRTAYEYSFLDLRLALPLGIKTQDEGGGVRADFATGLALELSINPGIPNVDGLPLLKTGVQFLCTPFKDETFPCSIQLTLGVNFMTILPGLLLIFPPD